MQFMLVADRVIYEKTVYAQESCLDTPFGEGSVDHQGRAKAEHERNQIGRRKR